MVLVSLSMAAVLLATASARAEKPAKDNAQKPAPPDSAAVNISAGVLAGETPAGARIEKALDEPTELDCQEQPLTDLIDFFKSKHHIEIQLDQKALEEAGVATDTPFTRHLRDLSLRSALKLLLREADLTFIVRDEMLLITTTAQAEAIMTLRVYPVADLINHDNLEVLDLHPVEGLIDTITGTVAANTWSEVGGAGSIKYLASANSLVISQTYDVQEEIREMLAALRKVQRFEGAHLAAGDAGRMIVAVHPLSAMSIRHHAASAGPTAGADDSADKGPTVKKLQSTIEASNRGLADDLVRAIPKLIEPNSWQGNGGLGTIETVSTGVIVRQSLRVQREIARLLRSIDSGIPGGMGRMSIGTMGGFFRVPTNE
jgi:hypothetical protein